MKQKTPLLRPLRKKGATMYVFPSATEDIGLNLNSRASGVALSHYALLNIPQFTCTSDHPENEIAEDLQNYVMNFETVLLNQETYNYQEYHTVSERVFWHWLRKKDIVQFKKDNSVIKEKYSNSDKPIETESDDRVIVCFGSIDAGNSLSTEFGIFNETYINIPTSYGAGPVFFKQVTDSNCTSKKYSISETNKLEGRETIPVGAYLTNNIPECDTTSVYDMTSEFDNIELIKSIDEIQEVLRKTNPDVNINSFDDININIDKLTNNNIILANEFKFNAILLYYSIYDQDDTTKSPYAINLFGIIFLDGPQAATAKDSYYIETFTKKKSNDSYFGNSYSFRVNIKTMSVYDNSDAVINDNTTLSSVTSFDFSDVISNLNRAIDTMNTNVHSTVAIQDAYMKILTYYDEQKRNLEDISTKINSLYIGNKTNKINTSTLLSNQITPSDTSAILISVDKEYNEYTDYQYGKEKYTAPVVIQNTHNIPAIYYPQVSLTEEFTEQNDIKELPRSIRTAEVVNNINVSWYTDDKNSFVYPILSVNNDIVLENKLSDLLDSSQNINYNLLTNILVDYVKEMGAPELTGEQLDKVIDSIDISSYINGYIVNINSSISNISTRLYSTEQKIDYEVNRLQALILSHGGTGGSGSSDMSSMKSDLNILQQYININKDNITKLNNDITNINNNISNINTTISNHDVSILSLYQNLNDTKNRVSDVEDTLANIYNAINSHTQSLNKVKDVLNDINKKLEQLTWKDQ